jgi:hypothetical protein
VNAALAAAAPGSVGDAIGLAAFGIVITWAVVEVLKGLF